MRNIPFLLTTVISTLTLLPVAQPALTLLELHQYGEGAMTFAAGSIRDSFPIDGMVSEVTGDSQTTGNKQILSRGDLIYLNLHQPEEASPGDIFTVYRRIHGVFHPADRKYLGDLFNVLGLVKILEVKQNFVTVEILRSYDAILPGDRVMRFVPLPFNQGGPRDVPFEGEAIIVEIPPARTLIAQRHVVYLDKGQEDGIRSGDRLEVFRDSAGFPRRSIGELKVLGVQDHTSSSVVVRSKYTFLLGDKVKLKEPAPELASQDEEPLSEEADSQEEEIGSEQVAELPTASPTDSGVGVPDEGNPLERLSLEGLVDQLEFDSGAVVIKTEGAEVLQRVSDILKAVPDKHIRVEGHTDDVPIGPTLRTTFPTNWELSKARADRVLQYLVEDGGVDAANLSAVGYADAHPIANNSDEKGRGMNRRVEILLYSSDPLEIPSYDPLVSEDQPGVEGLSKGEGDVPLSGGPSPNEEERFLPESPEVEISTGDVPDLS